MVKLKNNTLITKCKKHYWKENTLFSDGYFACSTGDVSTDIIKKYIENQG